MVLEQLASLVDLQTKLSIDDVDMLLMATDAVGEWLRANRK